MNKTETGPTTDELIAKYSTPADGGFPYPEVTEGMSDEQVKQINNVRAAVRRKAQAALVDFVIDNKADLEDSLNTYQQKALAFLTAEHPRGRAGNPSGTRGRITVAEKVYNFFADAANHKNADDEPTPGKVAGVHVYLSLEMGAKEILGAAKRILDSVEPDKRLWIAYRSSERVYTVAGPQADAPEGWNGPLPAPKAELEEV